MRITCKEAQTICDKGQYKEAKFLDKLKLTMHHLVCKACKEYSTQNSFLSLLLNKCESLEKSDTKGLTNEEKEDLQKKVEKELQTNVK